MLERKIKMLILVKSVYLIMFKTPIKIRWTGYARGRISEYNGDFSTERSDLFCNTVSRQKTNIVIKNVDEATVVYNELDEYHSFQRVWMNRSMDSALFRIRADIKQAMDKKGYKYEDGEFRK